MNMILIFLTFSFWFRSIGVLAYVMLTGVSPFLGDNKQETFLNISQMNLSYSEEEFDVVSESAVDFIKTLLVKKPEWVFVNIDLYQFLRNLLWTKAD